MTQENQPMRDRLEDYLDQRLSADEADQVRCAINADHELTRDVQLQQRIDASLRKQYAGPDAKALLERVLAAREERRVACGTPSLPAAPAQADEPRMLRKRRTILFSPVFAAAAMVLIALTGGVSFYLWQSSQAIVEGPSRYALRTLAQIYADEVKAGFTPLWECREPEKFQMTFMDKLYEPLAFVSIPANANVWGISYATTPISSYTVEVLARLDDTPIIVFVDRADAANGKEQTLPADSNLHVFKKTSGELVLYEVSPLNEPRILPLLNCVPKTKPPCPPDSE